MDRIVLRYWLRGIGVLTAALLLASLLSFQLYDPTLTNLRHPSGGIANLLGLPGALVGGSLLEFVGSAALLAPLLVLNWALIAAGRPGLVRYLGWCTVLLVVASGLHALALPSGDPGLLDPGLAGWALRHWAALTTGPWGGAAVLSYGGVFALTRVLYAPAVATAVRDARVFGGWFLREGWRQTSTGWRGLRAGAGGMHRVAGAAALGLTRRARLGLGDLLRLALRPPRLLAAWLAELRAPSLAGIKARAGDEGRGEPHRHRAAPENGAASGTATGAIGASDGFDQWYQAPAPPQQPRPAPGRPDRAAARSTTPAAPPPRETEPWLRPLRALDGDDEQPPERLRSTGPTAPAAAAGTKSGAPGATAPSMGPSVLPQDPADFAETNAEPSAATIATTNTAPDADSGGYAFEKPEAEAAWRQRFQRYARNLDLDWEEQLVRRPNAEPRADGKQPADEGER